MMVIDDVPKFKGNVGRVLSPAQARDIRSKLSKGVMAKSLAIDYNVSESTISHIKLNKNYKGIV
jgi:hypothetical protein